MTSALSSPHPWCFVRASVPASSCRTSSLSHTDRQHLLDPLCASLSPDLYVFFFPFRKSWILWWLWCSLQVHQCSHSPPPLLLWPNSIPAGKHLKNLSVFFSWWLVTFEWGFCTVGGVIADCYLTCPKRLTQSSCRSFNISNISPHSGWS